MLSPAALWLVYHRHTSRRMKAFLSLACGGIHFLWRITLTCFDR